MDRDAGKSDRSDEARHGDAGMIGSEAEEPGPGRDTSSTDPDPAAAGTDQPGGTVAMSEEDPMRTRLGSHVEGVEAVGSDVAAAEEGATRQTPPEHRPGHEPERPVGEAPVTPTAYERDPAMAAEPVDRTPGERTAGLGAAGAAAGVGVAGVVPAGPGIAGDRVEDVGPVDRSELTGEPVPPRRPPFQTEDAGAADRSSIASEDTAAYSAGPARLGAGDAMVDAGQAGAGDRNDPGDADVPATYTGEEADVTRRPEYADRTEQLGDRPLSEEEPYRADRPGGGGSLLGDEEDRLDRPGPEGEPGVQQGVYDQEADRAKRERPSQGV